MYNNIIHSRIDKLRSAMKSQGIDYYLIVTADYHSSEYVSDFFKCREYISGFTGSNGDLLVWQEGAALWTDGRYFTQAEKELDGTGITLMKMGEKNVPSVEDFLEKEMLPGQVLATDGRCIPLSRGMRLEEVITTVEKKACMDANNPAKGKLVWNGDLVDTFWENRPALPKATAWLLDEKYTGESRGQRLARVREKMMEERAEAMLFSSLDDIAWLLLIRGGDIEYNPVALCYLLVFSQKAYLYIDKDKLDGNTIGILNDAGIVIEDYEKITDSLLNINKFVGKSGKVWLDENRVSFALYMALLLGLENDANRQLIKALPTIHMKAIKTKSEIENEKAAHIKDAVAVTKLLYYLDLVKNDEDFISGKRKITELEIADILLGLRKQQEDFIEESFAPIIASGANGAIIHYEPTSEYNAVIEKDTFLLMDTGGQYMQGTTDITRTICMGRPSEKMKKDFTTVLKGHLALMSAVFPEGTAGPNLDILARKALWELGKDYRHGTGHGVGFLLNVHEGPQNINQRGIRKMLGTPFEAGMITSDEPGIYNVGEYGIRTENMILCEEAFESEYGKFLKFEALTLVPYDRKSIDFSLMNEEETCAYNNYNERVRKAVSPFLSKEERIWLEKETEQV